MKTEAVLIPEGMIEIDTEPAKQLGFTSDKFDPASYLWRVENTIVISLIIAKQKGMFRQLMSVILQNGFDFEIPTPSGRMQEIGKKQGWHLYQKIVDGDLIQFLSNKHGGKQKNEKQMLKEYIKTAELKLEASREQLRILEKEDKKE